MAIKKAKITASKQVETLAQLYLKAKPAEIAENHRPTL